MSDQDRQRAVEFTLPWLHFLPTDHLDNDRAERAYYAAMF